MRSTIVIFAAVLIAAGCILALVGIVGVLDPVGTKLADDSDPFGNPEPRCHGVMISVFGVALLGTSLLVLSKSLRRNDRAA